MSAFKEHCNQIVKEYIQTVLIIDDMAGFHIAETNLAGEDELKEPDSMNPWGSDETGTEVGTEAGTEIGTEAGTETGTETGTGIRGLSHSLEALAITDAFYKSGIIAGLFQPRITNENENEFANSIEKVALAADVIILDWLLKDHNANYSKALVKKILETDKNSGGRMRSIIIYTGTPELSDITTELADYLNLDNPTISDYKIVSENLLISFYNKPDSQGVSTREVAGHDLPDIVFTEFASLVNGIVPAFAVKATSSIRKNTGFLLTKFSTKLDAGYLAHRALLPKPDDAELFLLENFVSYLRNMLSISKVDQHSLNTIVLSKWAEDRYDSLYKTVTIKETIKGNEEETNITFSLDNINNILANGYVDRKEGLYKVISGHTSASRANKIFKRKENFDKFTQIFGLDTGEVVLSSKLLSVLNLFRRTFLDIRDDLPYLTQGSLVKKRNSDEYFVCVTPKCDTARVVGNRSFSFSKLAVMTQDQPYDLIVPSISDHEDFAYLQTNVKFYEMEHIEFNANTNVRILSKKVDGLIIFTSNDSDEYVWIGDLEDLEIQSRVSKIVGNLNRVGIDEVEWLRRRSN